MSSPKTRRRGRTAPPAATGPRLLPHHAAAAQTPLFDQTAAETSAETPAETPPPPAETAPALTAAELAEAEARLADVRGDADFRARKRELALEALNDKARLAGAQRIRDAELAAAHTRADVAEIKENAAARKWRERGKRWRKRAVTSSLKVRRLAVNIGITGAAIYGQWQYLDAKTHIGSQGAFAVSVLVELLAVSVLDYAHRRRQACRSSWHLYVVAAGMAGAVGAMNWAHWSTGDLALVGALFFLFSIAGPLLWSLSTIEAEVSADQPTVSAPRSARFPLEQWALFLPTTFRAKRLAVRHGIGEASLALDLLAERQAELARAKRARADAKRNGRGTVAAAPAAGGKQTPPTPHHPPVDPPADRPAGVYEFEGVPSAEQLATLRTTAPRELQAAARATARKAIAAGHRPTGKQLGDAYGLSDRWGRDRLAEVDKITSAA